MANSAVFLLSKRIVGSIILKLKSFLVDILHIWLMSIILFYKFTCSFILVLPHDQFNLEETFGYIFQARLNTAIC